jgi:MFS family permease
MSIEDIKGIRTFRAFSSRNYRLYFIGQGVSLIGTWMQKTAVSWVIYSATHSKFMLGVSVFCSLIPSFVLSSVGGAVADRYNKFRVLLTTQVASLIQAILVASLILFNHYAIWEILALSAVLGIINAFDVPARQSLVYDMVDDKESLPNALALNSSMVNFARIAGPALAGLVIASVGDGVCFLFNALSFVAVIISLMMMKLPQYIQKPHKKDVWGEIVEGWVYIKRTPSISSLVIILAFMSLLVLPFNSVLIPYYARDYFRGTARTFGIIDGSIGVGAFAGAIFLASLKAGTDLRRILFINTIVFGAGLILFSHERIYPLALFFAVIAGFGMMSQITVTNTLLQTTAHPRMRGRVISAYAMVFFGMQPLGGLLIGWVSEHVGATNTVLGQGVVAISLAGMHWRYLHKEKLKKRHEALLKEQHGLEPV